MSDRKIGSTWVKLCGIALAVAVLLAAAPAVQAQSITFTTGPALDYDGLSGNPTSITGGGAYVLGAGNTLVSAEMSYMLESDHTKGGTCTGVAIGGTWVADTDVNPFITNDPLQLSHQYTVWVRLWYRDAAGKLHQVSANGGSIFFG